MRNIVYVLLVLCLIFGITGCRREPDEELLKQIAQMQTPRYQGEEIRPEVLDEIKSTFLLYEEKIQDTVKASAQLGRYYKLLAKQYIEIEELKQEIALLKHTEKKMLDAALLDSDPVFHSILFIEYMSYEMYERALEEIKLGLEIYPDNPSLHYYAGVCNARLGKSKTDADDAQKKADYYRDALASYERALELQPKNVPVLSAMAVLYIFELDTSKNALPLLERALILEKNNSEVKFLLARVYYQEKNLDRAIELYESIAADAKSEEFKASAQDNLLRLRTEKSLNQ